MHDMGRARATILAGGALFGLVGLAGCADIEAPPFRYQPPPSIGGADREYCHGVARNAAETTYARYAAMMGTDPLGRRAGDRFGGSALAEHALAERDAVYEREMRSCLRAKGYGE
jgi:hypothetical protein